MLASKHSKKKAASNGKPPGSLNSSVPGGAGSNRAWPSGVPSPAASPSEQPNQKDANLVRHLRKTKLCEFQLRGWCRSGAACDFAHSVDEMKDTPDFYKTRICQDFVKGTCFDANCTFAHSGGELRTRGSDVKNKLCQFYERGTCRNGTECRFAHGEAELGTALNSSSGTPANLRMLADLQASVAAQVASTMASNSRTMAELQAQNAAIASMACTLADLESGNRKFDFSYSQEEKVRNTPKKNLSLSILTMGTMGHHDSSTESGSGSGSSQGTTGTNGTGSKTTRLVNSLDSLHDSDSGSGGSRNGSNSGSNGNPWSRQNTAERMATSISTEPIKVTPITTLMDRGNVDLDEDAASKTNSPGTFDANVPMGPSDLSLTLLHSQLSEALKAPSLNYGAQSAQAYSPQADVGQTASYSSNGEDWLQHYQQLQRLGLDASMLQNLLSAEATPSLCAMPDYTCIGQGQSSSSRLA